MRIHPRVGKPVKCTFGEEQRDVVLTAMTCYVKAVGQASLTGNEIKTLQIEDVEIVSFKDQSQSLFEHHSFFDVKLDLDQLATDQQVVRHASFEDLLGDFWPENETADEFLQASVFLNRQPGNC